MWGGGWGGGAEWEGGGGAGRGVAIDEARMAPGDVALAVVGKSVQQQLRHDKTDDAIAEEFEAVEAVAVRTVAAQAGMAKPDLHHHAAVKPLAKRRFKSGEHARR